MGEIFLIWTQVLKKNGDLVVCAMIKYYNYEKSVKTMQLWAHL